MKCSCSDVERVLPELLDGEPDYGSERTVGTRLAASDAASDIEAHLKSCPACSELVSDLKLISNQARQLAATEEPPPRVWVRIAADLRAERLISDQTISHPTSREPVPLRPILVPSSLPRRWSPWWLAPIAAGLIVAGSYVVSHMPILQVAEQVPAPAVTTPVIEIPGDRAAHPPVVASTVAPTSSAQAPSKQSAKSTDAAGPAPSAEDQQFLSVVSTLAPSTRTTYENELQAVNADIRETQAYVNRNPGDVDARQHLMEAYQQKALLYQIALDRVQ